MKAMIFSMVAATALLLCLFAPGVTATDDSVMQGVLDWQKVLGGSINDFGYNVQQTSDGGYIIVGYTTSSSTGDVGANHGGSDVWVVKLNSAGTLSWQKVLGGSGYEESLSIQQTSDGGYIVTGYTTSSSSGDVGVNHGGYDVWVVKLNSAGTLQWQKVLGGSSYEYGRSIRQTSDGGFILTGDTYSTSSGDVGVNHGGTDFWVVKLNSAGTLQWQKVLGGSDDEEGYEIQQTSDEGYILTGRTFSTSSYDVGANHGNSDVWVVRLNSAGTLLWQKVLGGSEYDNGWSIRQTSDSGYILTGETLSSSSGDVGANHGGWDAWVVKLNSAGTLQWQKALGGSSSDSLWSIRQASDSGYILTGYTSSSSSGDVGVNHGGYDVWVVKLNEIPQIRLSPGWNFVSTPRVLKSGSDTAGVVFAGVNTDSHSIFLYNASTKIWEPMTASSKVKVLDGIWIYSKYAATVSLNPDTNPLVVPGAKTLSSGWNAIGFSNIEPAYARDALASVSDKWSTAIGFDGVNQRYETAIINGGSGIYSDYRNMNPPMGYWVSMKTAGELTAIGA